VNYSDSCTFWDNYTRQRLNRLNVNVLSPSLSSIEYNFIKSSSLGDVFHLFCNFGMNTFALEKFSNTIVGLDFSSEAIECANTLSRRFDSNAKFICEDFFNFTTVSKYDTVYGSFGILDWVQDINQFINKVKHLLKPNGRFILIDFHSDFLNYHLSKIGEKVNDSTFTIQFNKLQKEKKSFLGNLNTTEKSFTKVRVHSTLDIIELFKASNFNLEKAQFFNYLPFNLTGDLTNIGPKQYSYSKVNDLSPLCFGVEYRKNTTEFL